MITVTDYIVKELADYGVTHIFGYVGARNVTLIESIYKNYKTRFVNVCHEQTAAFAACSYAGVSGSLAVAVSTSGPGATNMLTGIASAWCDSVPVLFLTGEVATNALRNGKQIRNETVQEVDIVGMAQPVTKYAVQIRNAADVPHELAKAARIAVSGRPGPVLIDLPEDIQWAEFVQDEAAEPALEEACCNLNGVVDKFREFAIGSKRPIIVLGNGAHGFEREIDALASARGIPVVASMSAIDIYDAGQPNYLGVAGNYGLRCSNFALSNADLVLALGCSMTKRYTGNDLRLFAPEAKVVRVDIDREELYAREIKHDELKIHADLRVFFDVCGDALRTINPSDEWLRWVRVWRERYFSENEGGQQFHYAVMYAMNRLRKANDIVTADVGSHQLWAIQSLAFGAKQKFVSTSGLSTMGYALPAAIGAHCADESADIICIVGDGGLQMTIHDLQYLAQEKPPITVVCMNNGVLGAIRTLQDSYYGGKHYASEIDYSAPDFTRIATAYGLRSVRVDTLEDFEKAFASRDGKPLLIDVIISPDAVTMPRITSRRPIYDLTPLLNDEELAENMLVSYERNKV